MKCKKCICKEGSTKSVCINPDSDNYTDFVKDVECCDVGIEEMSKEEYEVYMKVGESNEKSKSS